MILQPNTAAASPARLGWRIIAALFGSSQPTADASPSRRAHRPSTQWPRLAATIAFACLVAACSAELKPPRVEPLSATVSGISSSGIQLTIVVDVINDNAFPLMARSVWGRAHIDGLTLGKGKTQLESTIPAHGRATIQSGFHVAWDNLSALLPRFAASLPTGEPIPFTFDGNATIGGEKLNVDVAFTAMGTLLPRKLLAAGLLGR